MPTLADLKTRIVAETLRDDLEDELSDQLLTHIQRACEFYGGEKFWFNSTVTPVATTPSAATVAVPSTVRRVDHASISGGDLMEVTLGALPTDGASGIPARYAYYNDTLSLYPVPDAAYTLQLVGLAQIEAPADDGDSSVWTNEAQDLIVARAKMTLYRSQFRDPEGAQLAAGEAQEALTRLRRETAKRLTTPLRPRHAGAVFNINSGY
jgi:hypothetical protein